MRCVSRAARIAPMLVATAVALLGAQTLLEVALNDLTRFSGAAVRLITSAIAGVDTVSASKVPEAERAEVTTELRAISTAISGLRAYQSPLIFDLSEYLAKSRAGTLKGDDQRASWNSILRSVQAVSHVVKRTLETVEGSDRLKVALSTEDRIELREVLMTRGVLLGNLSTLQAPRSAAELDQLERFNALYRDLVASLGKLNASLLRATDRLK